MWFVFYLLIINIIAFIVYGVDKSKAKNGKWRISEFTLILLAVLGGALGAGIGMLVWHHKTRKPKFYITVPVLLVLQIIVIIWGLYQNFHLGVSEYDSDIGLGRDLRIVQISDLHNQLFGIGQSSLLSLVREQNPDIIVVTGDLVDSRETNYGIALTFIEGAVDIAPVYYITGNHEVRLYGEKFDAFVADMTSLGVVVLDDTYVDMGDYILAGIADISLDDFDAYERFDDSKPVIMLGHEPQYYELYESLGADLALSGHYHGGQFIIPGVGGFVSPEFEFFPSLYEGIHRTGDMDLVISRGLGNSIIPVRINNYPEVVVVNVS
ncbi:hypothetical protein SAMN02910456_02373 [Ruminococcaceae bacterium YRB3002]|nr:hypothetical protein SAMN02910456_02373 [Ruminococcaceae bacterium YRB3002]